MSAVHPSLARLSEQQANDHGEKTAIIFDGQELTFAQVHVRTLRRAAELRASGIRRGDRVAYLGPNHPALIETLLACLRLGAVFIPLNWRLTAGELDFQLAAAGVSRLIVSDEFHNTAQSLTADVPTVTAGWEPIPADGDPNTADGYVPEVPAAEVDGSEPALLLFTSGTTGRPKGAVLTHANILWNAFNLLLNTDLTADDRTLVAAPLFHVAALNQQVMTSFIRGASIIVESKWDIDIVFDLIESHRLTWLFGVTTMLAGLAQSPRWATTDLSSVRFVNSGGAPVPVSLIHDYQARDIMFCQGYGLTETAPGCTFLTAEEAMVRPGSAGRAVPFTEVDVRDASGNPCGPGVRGEIVARGPNVMGAYWNDEAATAAAFSPGGWFHTGDIGYLDEDGFLFIVDRLKDMFISGGENVYPAEIESALFAHPDVNEAAVVATADEKWGEVGHAFVVPAPQTSPTANELRAFLTERLAKYKVPKFFDIVDSLPRTGSGKVHKVSLRRTNALGAHSRTDDSTGGADSAATVPATAPTAPTKDQA
jgi:fatty-acyl-CoA synthase